MKIRLAKFIADAGIASRRAAEDLIARGMVSVNGEKVDTPVFFVEDKDVVLVDGKKVSSKPKTKLYAFHKPINTMTTRNDPDGRKTIYDFLPPELHGLKYIGRLDYKTTGLLLLTNDGELARKMTLLLSSPSKAEELQNNSLRHDKVFNDDRKKISIIVDNFKAVIANCQNGTPIPKNLICEYE